MLARAIGLQIVGEHGARLLQRRIGASEQAGNEGDENFQKSSVMPRASSVGRTRSRSPTEAPPMVTSTSAPEAACSLASSASRVSPAMPRSWGEPPARSTNAASPYALDATI